jgi:hypothetical protein
VYSDSTYCVSTFTFGSGTAFGVTLPDYAAISSVIVTPPSSGQAGQATIFLSYNYTGPDWVIGVGVWRKSD